MSNNSSPLRVGIKKGTFYLSQNDDGGSGWEKQEFKNPQTGEPMVKYHRNTSIEGNITYLDMIEDKYKGNCLSLLVNSSESEDTYSLLIPIMDTKGIKATNQYFNSLVGSLENVSKGDKITMFVNSKNEDKKGNLYRNIVTLDKDGKLIESNFNFKDVPAWDSKKGTDDFGKEIVEYDPSPTNKFYINLFREVVEKFKSGSSTNTQQPSTPAPSAASDDLPF